MIIIIPCTYLIDGPEGLLLVPLFAPEPLDLELVLHGGEEVHLENDPGIHARRVGQARDYHRPTVHVGKVQSFAHLCQRINDFLFYE